MPPLISCQHERRHANDVNHVAFSTVCGFSETSSAIYLIKLRFHIVASGALATPGAVWDILPTALVSPWPNGFPERLIGSIRRECVDHIIVLGEAHLRRILKFLCQILQPCQNASIPEQGRAGFSPGSANRCDQVTRHPGRTSSPLRPCLSFRYTQPLPHNRRKIHLELPCRAERHFQRCTHRDCAQGLRDLRSLVSLR